MQRFKLVAALLMGWLMAWAMAGNSTLLGAGPQTLPASSPGWLIVLQRISSTDGSATELARSYGGHVWEDLLPSPPGVECDAECSVTLPAGAQHRLNWLKARETTTEERAARFLLQATFGPTRSSVRNFSSSAITPGQWLSDQMALPPTLHRAYFRRRANPRLRVPLATGGVRDACHRLSRWRQYALTAEDEGRLLVISALAELLV